MVCIGSHPARSFRAAPYDERSPSPTFAGFPARENETVCAAIAPREPPKRKTYLA
jgi:hypothetical protein